MFRISHDAIPVGRTHSIAAERRDAPQGEDLDVPTRDIQSLRRKPWLPPRTSWMPHFGEVVSPSLRRIFPFLTLMGWVLLLVFAQSTGRIELAQALVLLTFPIVAVGVALRPAWVVLFFAIAPLSLIHAAPMLALVLLLVVTLVGQFVMRGWISVGWRSGFVGLIVLVGTSFFFRADVTGTTALITRGVWNSLALIVLLGLVSYNATRIGDLRGRRLVSALLLGLGINVALAITPLSEGTGILGVGTVDLDRSAAYLAAVGFTLCFARLLIRTESDSRYHAALHLLLAIGFGLAMIPGLVRGAWLSSLIAILFVSLWAGKKRYWLLILVAMALMLAVPVTRDRVVPSQQQAAGGGFTTGRLGLWTRLWDKQIEPALPWGNGFGHTFTLSSSDIFGPESTNFGATEEDSFVYPHNDFIFWMVELGILGLVGILVFWGQLFRAFRMVSRSTNFNRSHVQILSGLLITAFVIQFVGSVFLFTTLAVPFSIAAGFVFGARAATGPSEVL
jgi:hypothetical protein